MQVFIFILLPILLTVVGEFLLKFNVTGQELALNVQSLLAVFTTPGILFGILFVITSAILWIVGMSKFQLSFMYPFLSLNYVIIIVGSEFILKEDVTINRYISILLIIIGLVIISRSQNTKVKE
ncbi:MAG: hypothetical protein VXX85_07070 [Candidatus Margulisiibacteriota bacterium]|nr:hypothetical protein [Candidatus Margulisiibacteriota bacterium]